MQRVARHGRNAPPGADCKNPWVPLQIRGRGNGALLGRRLACEVNARAKFVVQILQGRNLLDVYTRRFLETMKKMMKLNSHQTGQSGANCNFIFISTHSDPLLCE